MPKILTEEEVKKVKKSLQIISLANVQKIINKGGLKPIGLNNGYETSFSLDVINENLRFFHLSVHNKKGNTDIEIAKSITNDILGEGFEMMGPMFRKNVIHFKKIEKENTMIEIMKDI